LSTLTVTTKQTSYERQMAEVLIISYTLLGACTFLCRISCD